MEDADIVCLQETKLKDSDVEACEKLLRPGLQDWHFYFNNSTAKKGYSGVAILSRCCASASNAHACILHVNVGSVIALMWQPVAKF